VRNWVWLFGVGMEESRTGESKGKGRTEVHDPVVGVARCVCVRDVGVCTRVQWERRVGWL
jgi:hypothetical protein